MKYLPLLWAALGRRVPRTVLTGLSIAIAFLLFGMLGAVSTAFRQGEKIAATDRLVTNGRYSLTQVLPYGHANQIRAVPGVERVASANWFGGYYQDEKNFFPQFAVDAQEYLTMYPELVMPAEQKQAWFNTRTGTVVAKSLADRFGWKIGDRIPMQAGIWPLKDGSNVWTFDLVGIFDTADPRDRSQYEMMLFRYDYFDEARLFAKGTAGWFVTKIKDPAQAPQLSKQIDALFANSPNETRTVTERAFQQGFVKQIGDIGLILSSIIAAVFFTLLFLTGNTMMQSVRERIPELAVLKTLGYTDTMVLVLVLAESLLMTVSAAVVGLALATLALPGIAAKLPGFSGLAMTGGDLGLGLLIAVVLALAVGLPPAIRAMRLDIVSALTAH